MLPRSAARARIVVILVLACPAWTGARGGQGSCAHGGDFGVLRAYVSKDGKLTPHSKDNVPYRPKRILKIQEKGIGPGELVMAAGVCARPVDFDALDGAPVELCFLLVGPESAAGAHVKALSRISRLLRRDALRDALRGATSADEFLRVVRESEAA